MTSAFTREYVEELRREGQRKSVRIRDLEASLIAKAMIVEASIRGIHPAAVRKISVLGVSVDDRGDVIGAAEAVRKFKETF